MFNLINSEVLFVILCVGFGVYAAYYLWSAFKFARGYILARKKYYEKYGKDSARHVNQFWGWAILFGVFCRSVTGTAQVVPDGIFLRSFDPVWTDGRGNRKAFGSGRTGSDRARERCNPVEERCFHGSEEARCSACG